MTHPAIAWRSALLDVNDVPSTARLVGVAMAEHASRQTGELWPSAARIASRTGLSERSVRDHIATLERHGWLVRLNQGGRPGGPRTSRWRIVTPERPSEVTPERPSGVHATTPEPPSTTPEPPSIDPGTSFTRTSNEPERTRKDLAREAREIVQPWWDQQHPKPAQGQDRAVKVVIDLIDKGYDHDTIRGWLDTTPTVTPAAFDYWRNTTNSNSTKTTADLAAESIDRVNRVMGMAQ